MTVKTYNHVRSVSVKHKKTELIQDRLQVATYISVTVYDANLLPSDLQNQLSLILDVVSLKDTSLDDLSGKILDAFLVQYNHVEVTIESKSGPDSTFSVTKSTHLLYTASNGL